MLSTLLALTIEVTPAPGALERAQMRVRAVNRTMRSDVHVVLADGTYRLAAPLVFTAADSGFNGHRVIWEAAAGAHPVISGGVRITGWHRVDIARNLWKAPVPANFVTRQLYVDGVRAQRASGDLPVTLVQTRTGYTASSPVMASWRNPSSIEFVYTGGLGSWTQPRCPVAAIHGTAIVMAQPCWDNSTERITYPYDPVTHRTRAVNLVGPPGLEHLPSYAENAYELLGTPGQWYLDETEHAIYYIPRRGEDLARAGVVAPVLETLLDARGSAAAPVHDITFRGLQFSYATWLAPSGPNGFSEMQANYTIDGPGGYARQGLCRFAPGGTCPYGDWTQLHGNVTLAYDRAIDFVDDVFAHLGGAGLTLGDASQEDRVVGSLFTDISGNGIELGGVDDPLPATPDERTTGNTIADNYLHDLAVEYHGGVAVDVGYAQDTTIAHNQIDDLPYSGISIGWGGWLDKIRLPWQRSYASRNAIEANRIFDTMQMLNDGGGIYTNGATGTSMDDGEQITGNVIYDQKGKGPGIYTDNGCAYATIADNVVYHVNGRNWATRHVDYAAGDGSDDPLLVEDNFFDAPLPDSDAKSVVVRGNHLIGGAGDVPYALLDAAGLEAPYRVLLDEHPRP